MASLVVIGYESEIKAEEVRLALLKLQKEYLIDLADAVVVLRQQDGKEKLRQMYSLTASGAASDEIKKFGGTLIKSNLCHENEAKLKAALASAQPAAPA